MLEQFHFIYPLWLWALIPCALLIWFLSFSPAGNNPWSKIIDQQLLPLLMSSANGKQSRLPLWLMAIATFIAIFALANPAWEQKPMPVFQTNTSRVIVLDLSTSMFSTDISPSRFSRARFKVEDILDEPTEAQTGLIVFAGDAFTVSPLTRDAETVRSLLKALDPRIMPTQGSRADLGLEKAGELLSQAGVAHGEILLIADGFKLKQTQAVAQRLRQAGHRISVMGAATKNGAEIKLPQGQLLRDNNGKVVKTHLNEAEMQAVAQAGGGIYVSLSNGNTDIRSLLGQSHGSVDKNQQTDPATQVQWKEQGPMLVLFLLPLAALAFRRGWLLSISFIVPLLLPAPPVLAFEWIDLWQRSDQQAAKAMQEENYEAASELATTPSQRGAALYRDKKYTEAVEAYSQEHAQINSADSAYNKGNALAKEKQYKEAIKAWDQALKLQPDMEDASANKSTVEKFLQQQEQNKDQQQNDKNNNGDKSDEQEKQQQEGDEGKDGEQQQPGEQSENEQKDGQKSGEDKDSTDDSNQFSDAAEKLKENEEKTEQGGDEGQENNNTNNQEQDQQQQMPEQASDENRVISEAEILSNEEQMAAEQWLRRIPDDPGGLLRRKFQYQYQQRQQRSQGEQQPW